MSKSFSLNGFTTTVAAGAPAVTGPYLMALGKRGPLFDETPAPTGCPDCNDFQSATVRRGSQLVTVDCHCVSPVALAG